MYREDKDLVATIAILALLCSIGLYMIIFEYDPLNPKFRVESAAVSGLNATGSELTASWDLRLAAANPNDDILIHVCKLQASLFYEEQMMLSTKPLRPPPTPLFEKNHTGSCAVVSFKLETVRTYVGGDVVRKINNGVTSLRLGLKVLVWFGYKKNWETYLTGPRLARLFCYGVQFEGFPNHSQNSTVCRGDRKSGWYYY